MLAADRMLLETNLRQSAIKLREKELNLYVENFSAMATQAAVFAGFTTTCLIEIHLPRVEPISPRELTDTWTAIMHLDIPRHLLHISSIISISANIICVSLSTITSIYGSGKALRGLDGSMDEAVDAMSKERVIIFRAFAIGLGMNLLTVMSACMLLMDSPVSYLAVAVVIYTAYFISSNSSRIVRKFDLGMKDITRLDDLTHPQSKTSSSDSYPDKHEVIMASNVGKRVPQVSLRTAAVSKQTV